MPGKCMTHNRFFVNDTQYNLYYIIMLVILLIGIPGLSEL